VKRDLPPADVSRETRERLEVFAAELTRWSRRINLISKGDLDHLWPRHIEDSLQLAPLLSNHDPPAIDLGSGGGFPGLILAIATAHEFHLVEADQRKATFLREAARLTNAPVTVHASRIEALDLPPARVVTARALAPLPDLLRLATPKLRPDGICLFLKGRTAQDELTQARRQWHIQTTQWRSRTNPDACILQLSEIAPVRPGVRSSVPT